MSVKMRQAVEREIISQFIADALRAGKRLAVSLERGWDTDEMLLGSTDPKAILEAATAGDEAHIFIQPKTGPTVDTLCDTVISEGWVYLVFGNDGWDVISDYTASPAVERLLRGALKVAAKYED